MTAVRARVLVRGRVQGVGFRESTRRRADELGLTGWVRNLRDGRVEALLEGERDAVERGLEFVRHGPRFAEVEQVDVADYQEGSATTRSFEVVATA